MFCLLEYLSHLYSHVICVSLVKIKLIKCFKNSFDLEVVDTLLIVSERASESERTLVTRKCFSGFIMVCLPVKMRWTLTSELTALKMLK